MFDDLTLEELRRWKAELYQFLRANVGVQSFSLPDGVSMNVTKDDAWKYMTEINKAIKKKLGRGGRFIGIELR